MMDYTRLSMRERCKLATFLDMGLGIAEIAKRLGRHRSTLYRELSRNHTQGYYRPGLAHHKAQKRHPRKRSKLQSIQALYHYIYDRLRKGWTPEQISGRMKIEKQPFYVCHETIYRYIYKNGKLGLYRYLPFQKKRRRRLRARKKSACRYGDIRLITERPEIIASRRYIGHWEGDLIAFSDTRNKTVTTLLERKSRLVKLIKNITKQSTDVMSKIHEEFTSRLSETPCLSITFDQGSEFANYPCVESAVGCKIYYCEKRSPWQKGSNENMNGRLRRYLPRHIDIHKITQKMLDQIAVRMNNTPRKCLGFRTPLEVFLRHLKN